MRAVFTPARLQGRMEAPPSKSMAHRLLIAAALTEGESVIHHLSESEDISATVACLRALGARLHRQGTDMVVNGIDMCLRDRQATLACGESASTLRFLIPIALLSGAGAVFTGTERLLSRPMTVYEQLFSGPDFTFSHTSCGITVGGQITGGEYRVAGHISSQFISGLLFALPLCEEDSRLLITPPIESRSYINLTLQALATFGIRAAWADEQTLTIPGRQTYRPCACTVEGDYSGAAFFEALNLLGGQVAVDGLSADSLQGDRAYIRYFEMLKHGRPTIHIGDCPDLGPILMAVAAARHGALLCGTHRLSMKESDRGVAMATELAKLGAVIEVGEDTIAIMPCALHRPAVSLCGHHDHRIVMALCTLLTQTGGEINDAGAVAKSMPDYFERLRALGASLTLCEE